VRAINFRCRGVSTELLIGERKRRDERFQRRTTAATAAAATGSRRRAMAAPERATERGERFRDRERFPRGKNPRPVRRRDAPAKLKPRSAHYMHKELINIL